MSDVRDLIIIGGGPAGYTAALYAARANLQPLVIEGFNWGGQLMITSDVENYPGYPDGVMGPEMMAEVRRQAERFGVDFITDDVTRVDLSERPFGVWVEGQEYRAKSVIVATGASARWLGLPCEQHFQGRGLGGVDPDARVELPGGPIDHGLERVAGLHAQQQAEHVTQQDLLHRDRLQILDGDRVDVRAGVTESLDEDPLQDDIHEAPSGSAPTITHDPPLTQVFRVGRACSGRCSWGDRFRGVV